MIHDLDESLRALVRREVAPNGDVDVVFDAPTKEWAARRNAPTVDVYLYDIREDLRRRQFAMIDLHAADGVVTGRRSMPRFFKLSYLLTAWTQRPEDEHRLLSALLRCFLRHDYLPTDVLVGELAEETVPLELTLAIPPPEDRALSDVWSALGGELKPSLDLVVIAPLDLDRALPAGPPVTAPPIVTVGAPGVEPERAGGRRVQRDRDARATGNGAVPTTPGDGDDAAATPKARRRRSR